MSNTTITLSGISNYLDFFTAWNLPAVNAGWDYGAFWQEGGSLITDPTALDPNAQYDQWGDGLNGGSGVLLESDSYFQLDPTNNYHLTGEVSQLSFGNGFDSSNADGMSITDKSLVLDFQDFDPAGSISFDLAIHDIYDNNSLSGLISYLGLTNDPGTGDVIKKIVIEDTTGDDVLVGFAGEDVFVFSGGHDMVDGGPDGSGLWGYQDGIDKLDVSAWAQWGITSFDDLVVGNYGGDTVISYLNDDGTVNQENSIQLIATDWTQIGAEDFIFAI